VSDLPVSPAARADRLVAAARRLPLRWTDPATGVVIEVSAVARAGAGPQAVVEVACQAWDGDRELPLDLPFRYVNPPTLVDDAQGDVDLGGGRRARYDPLAAVRAMVTATVLRFR
jgi:hypothetical protein